MYCSACKRPYKRKVSVHGSWEAMLFAVLFLGTLGLAVSGI
jgi:hypothetical protein